MFVFENDGKHHCNNQCIGGEHEPCALPSGGNHLRGGASCMRLVNEVIYNGLSA